MSHENVKEMLINIPTKFCRNMSHQFIQGVLGKYAADLSLHHFGILKLLDEHDRLYITEIVDCLSISRPQMTASANKLLASKYVTRSSDTDDRRKIYLAISEKGKTLVGQIQSEISQRIDATLQLLSSQEIEVLEEGLQVFQKLCTLCMEIDHEKGI